MSSRDPVQTQPRKDKSNVMTKFQQDKAIHVALRALTRKTAPPLPTSGYGIQRARTMFTFSQDIIRTSYLTKFLLTWKPAPPPGNNAFKWTGSRVKPLHLKTALPPVINGCQWTGTILGSGPEALTNVLPSCMTIELNIHIRKTAPNPGGHGFQRIETIFELGQDENTLEKYADRLSYILNV
ncbi:hypothetical protein DPMN_039014 [Dreissena polymorpha]|uniref:Uncharacterized protein n=1 Tax=Dreissena polymorpha TaxID=45954 RepID=A0A9D4MFS3_DREPO|nr:hypothetical protein DPMN_039014 [Dreissena polymorpha]